MNPSTKTTKPTKTTPKARARELLLALADACDTCRSVSQSSEALDVALKQRGALMRAIDVLNRGPWPDKASALRRLADEVSDG